VSHAPSGSGAADGRTRFPAAWLLSGLLGVGGCATLPLCPARGGPSWRELTSEHFDVRTDLDLETAIEAIHTLEEARTAMLDTVWGGAAGPPGRMAVIILGSLRELSTFVGRDAGGDLILRHDLFPPTILVPLTGDASRGAMKHELAHLLSRWFLPLQPDWYSEGVASFLETIRYDRGEGRAYLGEPKTRYEAISAAGPTSILGAPQLFGDLPVDMRERLRFYATSWTLVHYLFNHRNPAFVRFQHRLATFELPEEAWAAEFPDLTGDGLIRELTQYRRSGQYFRLAQAIAPWNGDIAQRLMADNEVHALRAYLYAYVETPGHRSDRVRARAEVAEALREDPATVAALALQFYLLEPRVGGWDDDTAGRELAKRALAGGDANWMAWLMVADAANRGDTVGRKAIERAWALAPHEPVTLARMALLRASQNRWKEVVAFSSEAIGLGFASPEVLLLHAAALDLAGECEGASRWIAALSHYWSGPASSPWFRAVLSEWRAARVACATERPPAVLSKLGPMRRCAGGNAYDQGNKELVGYESAVLKRIEPYWFSSPILRAVDPYGYVYGAGSRSMVFEAGIDAAGQMTGLCLGTSSGVDFLDRSAWDAVISAATFPAPPAPLLGADSVARIEIGFRAVPWAPSR
jgi:hypothetical protein